MLRSWIQPIGFCKPQDVPTCDEDNQGQLGQGLARCLGQIKYLIPLLIFKGGSKNKRDSSGTRGGLEGGFVEAQKCCLGTEAVAHVVEMGRT